MQCYVDIPPHLTYVATLPCETLPKNQRNSPCSKKPSRYIRHYIMANCRFVTQHIISNSLKRIATFRCQIS